MSDTKTGEYSIPELESESLNDIFGPIPLGGDFVDYPDNPPHSPPFSRELAERIADLVSRSTLDGSCEATYEQILSEVRSEEADDDPRPKEVLKPTNNDNSSPRLSD